ncbi:MAG TPA: fused MFS/spermidine synthase [bacterium]|nr:fused MFS/spermidine synthase [bacterium]
MSLRLRVVVFIVGLAVMAVELTAVRLLAPHFGTSLFVWTNVIAVVLVALAAGYGLGGRWADRLPVEDVPTALYRCVFGAGLWIVLLPAAIDPLTAAARFLQPGGSVVIPSLFVAAFLFGAPVFAAGLVTPLAARSAVRDAAHVGRPLGGLFVLSTLGSLAGTFLPVFATIPYAGVRATFWIVGGLMLVAGAAGGRRRFLVLALVLALIAWSEHQRTKNASVLWEGDSVYQHLRVFQNFDGSRFLQVNEGRGMQSYFRPDTVWTGYYWDTAAIPPRLQPGGRNYLFLGLGGGTAARIVHESFPDVSLDGVEIDPKMVEAGRRFFGLEAAPVAVSIADARVFLEATEKVYDYVMLDVYRDNRSIPAHLATREFFELVRNRLTPKGILLMNVSTAEKGRELLGLIRNTLASVFPKVYQLQGPAGAVLLFGFREEPSTVPSGMAPVIYDATGETATDDRSRAEILAAQAVQ